MINKKCTLLLAIGIASLAVSPSSQAMIQSIAVHVNGETVPFSDARPQRVNGRVLVPLRGVLEQIGADISWNEATQTVKARMGEREIELQLGSRTAQVDGRSVTLAVPAMRIGGSTMVPLRFIGEALGVRVDWNEATQVVDIGTNRSPQRDRGNRTPDRSRREIVLRIDGHEETFGEARPYMSGMQVMVPLERIAALAKFSYRYDSDENMVLVRDKQLKSVVGSRLVEKDGRRIRMDSSSEMHNGAVYVPLEFIELASARTATWNRETRTILITASP